jgi:hypothetical protein
LTDVMGKHDRPVTVGRTSSSAVVTFSLTHCAEARVSPTDVAQMRTVRLPSG